MAVVLRNGRILDKTGNVLSLNSSVELGNPVVCYKGLKEPEFVSRFNAGGSIWEWNDLGMVVAVGSNPIASSIFFANHSNLSNALGVPKSTLSYWLRDVPLTDEEKRKKAEQRIGRPIKDRGEESRWYKQSRLLDRNHKGRLAEAAVLFRMILNQFSVFGSPFDGERTDWIVEVPRGTLYKVQVRWAKENRKGLPCFQLYKAASTKE